MVKDPWVLDPKNEQDMKIIEFITSKEPNVTLSKEALNRFKQRKPAKRG